MRDQVLAAAEALPRGLYIGRGPLPPGGQSGKTGRRRKETVGEAGVCLPSDCLSGGWRVVSHKGVHRLCPACQELYRAAGGHRRGGQGAAGGAWCFRPSAWALSLRARRETALSGGFDGGQVRLVTGEDEGYVVKFKAIELWEQFCQWAGRRKEIKGQAGGEGRRLRTSAQAWYADAVGVGLGQPGGRRLRQLANSAPEDSITREQMAAILYRYAKVKGCDTTQGGMAVREFADYEQISDWAGEAMAWAVNAKVLSGKGQPRWTRKGPRPAPRWRRF